MHQYWFQRCSWFQAPEVKLVNTPFRIKLAGALVGRFGSMSKLSKLQLLKTIVMARAAIANILLNFIVVYFVGL
jgi:hypothetical protein